jgi:hypothetical protein
MVIKADKRKVRLSITVDPELKKLAEAVADENNTTPSGVISQCLAELAEKRKEEAMKAYYLETAKEHDEFDKNTRKMVEKIVAEWGD